MQKLKNLVIPGIAGILLACAIFSAFVMAPWSETTKYYIYFPPLSETSPIIANLTISEFTEPLGPGSEAELTVIVISTCNASNVIVQSDLLQVIDEWPMGISLVGGNLSTWNGDLRANVPIIFTVGIRAVEVGYARIRVIATWYPEGFHYDGEDSLWILVLEDNVQISNEWISPPGSNETTPHSLPSEKL